MYQRARDDVAAESTSVHGETSQHSGSPFSHDIQHPHISLITLFPFHPPELTTMARFFSDRLSGCRLQPQASSSKVGSPSLHPYHLCIPILHTYIVSIYALHPHYGISVGHACFCYHRCHALCRPALLSIRLHNVVAEGIFSNYSNIVMYSSEKRVPLPGWIMVADGQTGPLHPPPMHSLHSMMQLRIKQPINPCHA